MSFFRLLSFICIGIGMVQFMNNSPIDGLILFLVSYRFGYFADMAAVEVRIKALEKLAGIENKDG